MHVNAIACLALAPVAWAATSALASASVTSALVPLTLHGPSAKATSSPKASSPLIIIGSYTPTATVATFVSQPTSISRFNCDTGAHNASTHLLNSIHRLHVADLIGNTGSHAARAALAARANTLIKADLYIHVVLTNANKNSVTKQMVLDQAATLNNAYRPYNIQFTLRGSDFTINDAWSVGATDADDIAMKRALRKGSYRALNIYFHSDMAGGVLGKCTLPTQVGPNAAPASYAIDGCNVAAGTMPGGAIYGYNQGKTTVHETGHWLGLLHTFEGYSCDGPGDFIADTPQEAESTNGCPTSPAKNSCGHVRAGFDPIHNFMDYSTDVCYVRFTPGQMGRVRSLWSQYRDGR